MSENKSTIGLEYAGKWFEFHANQRQDVFKIFFLFCAGCLSASGFFIEKQFYIALIPLGVTASFLSLIFWLLDRRTRKLIELGEESYRHFWECVGLPLERCPVYQASATSYWDFRYKHAYALTFIGTALAGLAISFYGLTKSW
ncbi:hypothetical protein [Rhizobium rhizoryzae]|uniref:hypothetical protein n=1 Tax=Rhizobium rhizoryzae TaxID=451876 RepID=UPI0028A5FEAB|nr:hypothetical protein [Rhizobium rhizoryzae]